MFSIDYSREMFTKKTYNSLTDHELNLIKVSMFIQKVK